LTLSSLSDKTISRKREKTMKVLIKVGSKISFNELPDSLDFETEGTVTALTNYLVIVHVPGWGYVSFDLAGSSWSRCDGFKRETPFVSWSD
jgi:hypothetical protein